MNLPDCCNCCRNVICFGMTCKHFLNWVHPSWYIEYWTISKESAELLSIQRSGTNDEFEISAVLYKIFEESEQYVGTKGSFVSFIKHDDTVPRQSRISNKLS